MDEIAMNFAKSDFAVVSHVDHSISIIGRETAKNDFIYIFLGKIILLDRLTGIGYLDCLLGFYK